MVGSSYKSFEAQLKLKNEELQDVISKFEAYKLASEARLAQLKQSQTDGLADALKLAESRMGEAETMIADAEKRMDQAEKTKAAAEWSVDQSESRLEEMVQEAETKAERRVKQVEIELSLSMGQVEEMQARIYKMEQIKNEAERNLSENVNHQEGLELEMERVMQLNENLELGLDALSGQVWSLEKQLKESCEERDNLVKKLSKTESEMEIMVKEADKSEERHHEMLEEMERRQQETALEKEQAEERIKSLEKACLKTGAWNKGQHDAYNTAMEYCETLQNAYNELCAREIGKDNNMDSKQNVNNVQSSGVQAIQMDRVQSEESNAELERLSSELESTKAELSKVSTELAQLRQIARVEMTRLCELVAHLRGDEIAKLKENDELELEKALEELPKCLETTQIELTRHITECTKLHARVKQLESINREASEEINREAAQLSAKRVENDALSRCNAEMAHTNARLKNEVDKLKDELQQVKYAAVIAALREGSGVEINNEDGVEVNGGPGAEVENEADETNTANSPVESEEGSDPSSTRYIHMQFSTASTHTSSSSEDDEHKIKELEAEVANLKWELNKVSELEARKAVLKGKIKKANKLASSQEKELKNLKASNEMLLESQKRLKDEQKKIEGLERKANIPKSKGGRKTTRVVQFIGSNKNEVAIVEPDAEFADQNRTINNNKEASIGVHHCVQEQQTTPQPGVGESWSGETDMHSLQPVMGKRVCRGRRGGAKANK